MYNININWMDIYDAKKVLKTYKADMEEAGNTAEVKWLSEVIAAMETVEDALTVLENDRIIYKKD